MKMDTTTWVLMAAVLLFLLYEWQKKQATGSLSGGYRPGAAGAAGAAGATGAAGKQSLLQQLLGGTGNTQKPSAGVGGGAGAGAGAGAAPAKAPSLSLGRNPWKPPGLTQVPYLQSVLSSLVPSIAPPVYTPPEMNYPGAPQIPTIPSDTSNIFLMPDTPPAWDYPTVTLPTYTATSTVFDPNTGIPIPTSLPDQTPDPTAFSPVDLQTIDTTTLGGIAYQQPTTSGTPVDLQTVDTSTLGDISYQQPTQWYDPNTGNLGPAGDSSTNYADMPDMSLEY